VSLSGYYAWRKKSCEKRTKEDREKEIIETLKAYCQTRKKGYRRVTMDLLKDGILMNHKKVLRLMKKYNLLSKIRQKNPYKQLAKASQEHKSMANILNRNFS
jgi:putative transposase